MIVCEILHNCALVRLFSIEEKGVQYSAKTTVNYIIKIVDLEVKNEAKHLYEMRLGKSDQNFHTD